MITIVTTVSDSHSHKTYGKSNFVVVKDGYTEDELALFTKLIFLSVSQTIQKFNEDNK